MNNSAGSVRRHEQHSWFSNPSLVKILKLYHTGESIGEILVRIADTGIGIPEEFHDRIFNRFERYDENALVMDVAGTGLGLSIVKALVEMHEGDVWFESTVGVGTTFYIALPVEGPRVAPTVEDMPLLDARRDA